MAPVPTSSSSRPRYASTPHRGPARTAPHREARRAAADPRTVRRRPLARITFSGFSDGASYALSLALVNGDTFRGVAAFSPGFIQLSGELEGKPRVFLSHGRSDQVLPFERCGSAIAARLRGAGYAITFEPFDGRHEIPEETLGRGFAFLANG